MATMCGVLCLLLVTQLCYCHRFQTQRRPQLQQDSGSREQQNQQIRQRPLFHGRQQKQNQDSGSREQQDSSSREQQKQQPRRRPLVQQQQQQGSGSREQKDSGSREQPRRRPLFQQQRHKGSGSKEQKDSGRREQKDSGSRKQKDSSGREQKDSGGRQQQKQQPLHLPLFNGGQQQQNQGSGNREQDSSREEQDQQSWHLPLLHGQQQQQHHDTFGQNLLQSPNQQQQQQQPQRLQEQELVVMDVTCNHEGDIFQLGQTTVDPCKPCRCMMDGQMLCTQKLCLIAKCADAVRDPGQCCYRCPNGENCKRGTYVIKKGQSRSCYRTTCTCPEESYCAEYGLGFKVIQAQCQ